MTDDTGSSANGPTGNPSHSVQAVFLERQSYRRRRLIDVARLLPLLGVLLLLVPLLWPESDWGAVSSGQVEQVPMSDAITYVFSVWVGLIIAAVLFGVAARRWGGDERQAKPRRD